MAERGFDSWWIAFLLDERMMLSLRSLLDEEVGFFFRDDVHSFLLFFWGFFADFGFRREEFIGLEDSSKSFQNLVISNFYIPKRRIRLVGRPLTPP